MSQYVKRISSRGSQTRITGGFSNKLKPKTESKLNQNGHRSFKEMIEWRRERQKKERLDRNKVRAAAKVMSFNSSLS